MRSEPLLPAAGILPAVHSKHDDLIGLQPEIDGIGEALQDHPSHGICHLPIAERVSLEAINGIGQRLAEQIAQATQALLVSAPDVESILPCLRQKPHRQGHARPRSWRTTSQLTASCGCC
jgi:hypothetical protein